MLSFRYRIPSFALCNQSYHSLPLRLSHTARRSLSLSSRNHSFALYDVDDHEEHYQNQLRLTPKMPTPGLMFVTSRPLDSSKSADEKYNHM